MIHHISIPAENPGHVADILAEIWQGKAYPFPVHTGSYVVFASNNNQGIAIEVYPIGTEMTPGIDNQDIQYRHNPNVPTFVATHAALSVPISQAEIEAIATREGWRSLWFDLLTPEMMTQYQNFMNADNWEQFLVNIS
jgi:hypothetical protein